MWTTIAQLTGTETLVEYGTLLGQPKSLMRDGLAEVVTEQGAFTLNLDAEVLINA
jgi:hypothetical protein